VVTPSQADKSRQGVTLIETVAAILVMGLALPPLAGLFTEISNHSVDDLQQRVALSYAESLLEEIVSKEFEDPDEADGSFGTEETDRIDYDDIDDFDGLSNSSLKRFNGSALDDYSGFTRSVVVDNVSAADPDPATPLSDGSTEFKRIKVTVAWTGGKGGEITLSTLRTKLVPIDVYDPLDFGATITTIAVESTQKFSLDLVSISASDHIIKSFALSADDSTYKVKKLKLEGATIWDEVNGVSLPTGGIGLNDGTSAERTVTAGASPNLEVEFKVEPSGTITYTLVLYYLDNSVSTLNFTVSW
jgi:MSHA pilin protein MshD